MSNIMEENGKALGQAVKDIGSAFMGSIVSIAKDVQTIGRDTFKMMIPDFHIGEIVLAPHPNFVDDKKVRARVVKIEGDKISLEHEDKEGGFWDLDKTKINHL